MKTDPTADEWPPSSGAYVSTVDVATYLGVEVSTVQRWARTGQLPGTRLGGIRGPLRFRKREIERWVARQPRAAC